MLRYSKEYLKQAFSAFENKNYKLCLILLRDVNLDDSSSTTLLADCAYAYWKEGSESYSEDAEAVNSKDREDTLILVKDSFALLLGNGEHDKIKAFDYIRLSHIYLSEGSLDGALQILKLASARGYLLNSLIILQSWTILKRIGDVKDADSCLQYLSTSIALESKSTPSLLNSSDEGSKYPLIGDSPLPLHVAMLHCANFVQRRASAAKTKAAREKELLVMKSMITEAYILYGHANGGEEAFEEVLRWFQAPGLWLEVGQQLEHTPFVLLAEDSYWEAFLRDPSSDEPLARIVRLLQRYRRSEQEPFVLARAYRHNPWSLLSRRLLAQRELQLAAQALALHREAALPWNELFRSHELCANKVQAHFRGWVVRSQWPARKARLLEIKALFLASIDLATLHAAALLVRLQGRVVTEWRAETVARILHRHVSATHMQRAARGRLARLLRARLLRRVRRANGLFVAVCQNTFDMSRLLALRRWRALYMDQLKHRYASMLAFVIERNAVRKQVRRALSKLLPVIHRRNARTTSELLRRWRERYEHRVRNHARITVRFFVRGSLTRRERERLRLQLLAVEEAVQAQNRRLELRRDPLVQVRVFWTAWRTQLARVRDIQHRQRAIGSLSRWLPILHARKRARASVRVLRARGECQRALVRARWVRRVAGLFAWWRGFVFASVIQRFVRCVHADWELRRRKMQKRAVLLFVRALSARKKERSLFRWKKFCYLQKRMRARAARRITLFFFQVVLRARIRRVCTRKRLMFAFLDRVHCSCLRASLRALRASVANSRRAALLGRGLALLTAARTRSGLVRWTEQTRGQRLLRGLLGPHYTISFRPHRPLLPSTDPSSIPNNDVLITCRQEGLLPFERLLPARPRLLDVAFVALHKAFVALQRAQRSRQRLRRGLARGWALQCQRAVLAGLALRRSATHILQRFCGRLVLLRARGVRMKQGRLGGELRALLLTRSAVRVLRDMQGLCVLRARARLTLQGQARRILALQQVARVRAYLGGLGARERQLDCSLMQRALVRARWVVWLHGCCERWASAVRNEQPLSRLRPAALGGGAVFAGPPFRNLRPRPCPNNQAGRGRGAGRKKMSLTSPGPRTSSEKAPQEEVRVRAVSFQSSEFHRQLQALRRSGGVFLLTPSMTSEEPRGGEGLTGPEVDYFLNNASTVLAQNVCEHMLRALAESFSGAKLVLLGGMLTADGLTRWLSPLVSAPSLSELQVRDVAAGLEAVLRLVRAVRARARPQGSLGLEVDARSLGVLGVGLLLRSLQDCEGLRALTVHSHLPWTCDLWGDSLLALSRCPSLQELRLLGSPISESAARRLQQALQSDGFQGLCRLELGLTAAASEEEAAIVRLCKDRAYVGRRGLSLTVNS